MEITFPREKDPSHYVLYYITYLLFLRYKFHTLIVSRRTFSPFAKSRRGTVQTRKIRRSSLTLFSLFNPPQPCS